MSQLNGMELTSLRKIQAYTLRALKDKKGEKKKRINKKQTK